MTFRPPVADQRFLLEHVVGMAELQGHNAYGDATPDTVGRRAASATRTS